MSEEVAQENLVAYRLKKVEDGVTELNRKLDKHIEIEAVVHRHSFDIEALKTSRNRIIAAVTTVGVGSAVALISQVITRLN